MVKFIERLKNWWNPNICWKHKIPLSMHGYDENIYCKECHKELGRYYYEA